MLLEKKLEPPFKPLAVDPYDTRNFIHSNNITNPEDTIVDKKIDSID